MSLRTLSGLEGGFLSFVADDEGFSTYLVLVEDGRPYPLRCGRSIFEGCEKATQSNILHVYGQDSWHDDSVIVGDRTALEGLQEALEGALDRGQSRFWSAVTDDRGFEILIKLAEDTELLRAVPLPYRAEFARGPGDRLPQLLQLFRKDD